MKLRTLTSAILCLLLTPPLAHAQVRETIPNTIPIPTQAPSPVITAVDLEGDLMAVGISGEDNMGSNKGAVYLLGRHVGGTNAWGVLARLESQVPNSKDFGYDVALDGDTLVVLGSQPIDTLKKHVAAYVFSRNQGGANGWGEVANFTIARISTAALTDFVADVALDGDTLAVGIPFTNGADGDNREGRVDIFSRNQGGSNNWGRITRISNSNGEERDTFGFAIALEGDRLVASAPGERQHSHVFAYARNQGGPNNWGETHKWTRRELSECAVSWCDFGMEVALSGQTLVVTTRKNSAFFTDIVDMTSSQFTRLTASDGESDDVFGRDLKLEGTRLYVGAREDDDHAQNSGSVYVFEHNAGSWNEVKKLQAPNPMVDDNLGWRLDVDGGTIALAWRTGVLVNGPTPNFAPLAQAQVQTTPEDTPIALTLSATDTEPLTYTLMDMPGLGTLTGTAPNLTYTPNPDAFGQDTFTFVASDGTSVSAPATVTINITPVNDAPTANPITRATQEDKPLNLTLSGDDVEGDTLTFRVVDAPMHGEVTGTGSQVIYTPDSGFVGQDTFTYVAHDGETDSMKAIVVITVNALRPNNQAPTATPQAIVVDINTPRMLTLMGTDPEGDGLSFSIVEGPSNGTLTGDAPNLTYTPHAEFSGEDTFTFQVSDGDLTSATATVTLRVLKAQVENKPPMLTAPEPGTTWEATVGEESVFAVTATDPEQDTLQYTAVGLPQGAVLDMASGQLRWTPEAEGSFGVALTVTDGQGTDSRHVTLLATSESIVVSPMGQDDGCSVAPAQKRETHLPWYGLLGVLLVFRRRRPRQ